MSSQRNKFLPFAVLRYTLLTVNQAVVQVVSFVYSISREFISSCWVFGPACLLTYSSFSFFSP